MQQRGLTLVARNLRSRFGEVDLVMRDADCLVFVEVRYRRSGSFANAAESVDRRKQRKLSLTAAYYLSRQPQYADKPVRFDVIAMDRNDSGTALNWITDAFRPEA